MLRMEDWLRWLCVSCALYCVWNFLYPGGDLLSPPQTLLPLLIFLFNLFLRKNFQLASSAFTQLCYFALFFLFLYLSHLTLPSSFLPPPPSPLTTTFKLFNLHINFLSLLLIPPSSLFTSFFALYFCTFQISAHDCCFLAYTFLAVSFFLISPQSSRCWRHSYSQWGWLTSFESFMYSLVPCFFDCCLISSAQRISLL